MSVRGKAVQDRWCILRTAGRSTLPLAESLAADGFDVWTPAEQRRYPRTRDERPVPIMPTFAFAKARHLWSLVSLAEDQRSHHPAFSVFRHRDSFPVIADYELEHLRSVEERSRRRAPKPEVEPLGHGEQVRVPSGSFGGMSGVVVESDGRFTLVCFGGHMQVKISTFLLRPVREAA